MTEYEQNLRKLVDLMHCLGRFTEKDLKEIFFRGGVKLIDGSMTIRQFLAILREHRVVRLVRGQYEMVNR